MDSLTRPIKPLRKLILRKLLKHKFKWKLPSRSSRPRNMLIKHISHSIPTNDRANGDDYMPKRDFRASARHTSPRPWFDPALTASCEDYISRTPCASPPSATFYTHPFRPMALVLGLLT